MEKLIFMYDKKGDVLDIAIGKPKPAICQELGEDMVVRKDRKTREIVGFTILNFEKRFEKSCKPSELKIPVGIHLTAAEA